MTFSKCNAAKTNGLLLSSSPCSLCPRKCGAMRALGENGLCGAGASIRAAKASIHEWEEPCLSGSGGSGTVFFSGCPLKCVFCQNREISEGGFGKDITVARLAEIFLSLQEQGAHNINLVTAAQYVDSIIEAVEQARGLGLRIPIVYNSSGYERVETLRALQGTVDIYLPDFKYMCDSLALRYSGVRDYVKTAMAAIDEMVGQQGECIFDESGILKRGVIIRHLMLPLQLADTKRVLEHIYKSYGDHVFISLMSQYTPFGDLSEYPELAKPLSPIEYEGAVDYALELGIENGYLQEGEVAKESFIPPFDLKGI